MTPELRIARGLKLPTTAATQTFAILAQRRKGKTYTASVIAEEMVEAKMPWVALDPTGAWWGLRAGKDGKRKGGLPVYVFGGDHGDLPLERSAGAQIADLVVETPRWYVLDLSHFESKAAEREFATAFAERFYRRKGKSKSPMHLFIDEADIFVPQRVPSGDQRMLGAFESIVRRGGIRGIGTTLISQRPAVVNKNVLEQLDVLVILRVVGPNDQKAIKAYVDAHGTDAEQRELMGSLASLELGEAWFWEPGSGLFKRVKVRERRTFNSSATPDSGGQAAVDLAEIDLEALRGKLDRAIEKAKAEDPKQLRREISRLQKELAERPAETETVEVEKVVEVPVLAEGNKLETVLLPVLERLPELLQETSAELRAMLARFAPTNGGTRPAARPTTPSPPPRERVAQDRVPRAPKEARDVGGGGDPDGETKLKTGMVRMLRSLAMLHPEPLSRIQAATLSDIAPNSGTVSEYVTALKRAGYLTEDSRELALTEEGRELVADHVGSGAPSPEELRNLWAPKLKEGMVRMLDRLIEIHPDGIARADLAEQVGIAPGSGTVSEYVTKLKRNALAEEHNRLVYAGEALFLGARV